MTDSLPNAGNERRAAPSRRQLWLVLAVFLTPLALAFVLYYGIDGWRPAGSTARGELIDPARPLPEVVLPLARGGSSGADFLRKRWSLVFIGAGRCDARCRAALVGMRQVRLALGDDMDRIERVFLVNHACCDLAYLDTEHDGLITAELEGEAGARLLAVFADAAPGAATAGRTFIVDPLGNLMMSYPPDAPPKAMLEDLKKLLKLSHIG